VRAAQGWLTLKLNESSPIMKQRRYVTYWMLAIALWGSPTVFAEPFVEGFYLGAGSARIHGSRLCPRIDL